MYLTAALDITNKMQKLSSSKNIMECQNYHYQLIQLKFEHWNKNKYLWSHF